MSAFFQFGSSPWESVSQDSFVKAENQRGSLEIWTKGSWDENGEKINDDIHSCVYYRNDGSQTDQEIKAIQQWANSKETK